jgi:hypothetical protein
VWYDRGSKFHLEIERDRPMRVLLAIMTTALLGAGAPPVLEPLGKFDLRKLPEASGIVKSRRHPGIFWVHNDSGNSPSLFAIHRDGTIVGEFRIDAPNLDWEDIAADDQGHLYLGDIGNNGGWLAVRTVYQIDEPDPARPAGGPLKLLAATSYRLPQSARFDAEGLIYDASTGSAIIVSKRFDGRDAELFAVTFHPPAPLNRPVMPRRVGTLPGFVEPATGASLSEDGRRLAVCSTSVTRIYQRSGSAGWELQSAVRYAPAEVEGVTWDGNDLILVSEGRGVDRIAEQTWKHAARGAPAARQASANRK